MGYLMAECTAWELQLVDPANNNDKFYRIYAVGAQVVSQYGRNGTVGACVVKGSESARLALDDAEKLSYAKEAKGYDRVGGNVTFEVPDGYLSAIKGHASYLDAQFRKAQGNRPTSPERNGGSAAAARRKAKDAKDMEAFKQQLLRMRDTARKGLPPKPERNPEIAKVNPGENETAPGQGSPLSPIELALAQAIAAKKANA